MFLYVPLNLEDYAENIVPVASIDVQALRTGNNGGVWASSIVYRPVVDADGTQTGSGIRACHSKLVPVWTRRGVEQVEVAEVELVVLLRQRGWNDLEIGHGVN
jgi:hypothetical protein